MAYEDNVKAVQSLVLTGEKQDFSVLFISVKEIDKKEEPRLSAIISKLTSSHKGVIGESPEGTFMIFFNFLSRHLKHELEAIKMALDVQRETMGFNALKLGFGINNGKVVMAEVEDRIVKYTCLGGDSLSLARKLSFKSENEILFSGNVNARLGADIKAQLSREMSAELKFPVYLFTKIVDREQNSEFISRFLQRMKEESSKSIR